MKTTEWVVLASYQDEQGEWVCETFAEALGSREEAEDVAYDMLVNLGSSWEGTLEVATAEDAADVVSE